MLLIKCPWCGPRAQIEFFYGAGANVKRPADPENVSDEAWHDFVFMRDNPKGPHAELWQHANGCRAWFKVLRNTHSHEILATAKLDEDFEAAEAKVEAGS